MDKVNILGRQTAAITGRWLLGFALSVSLLCSTIVTGQDPAPPQWIWSPEHAPGNVPQGDCFFRKTIHLQTEHRGKLLIAADDEFVAYVNGKKVASGNGSSQLQSFEITKALREGKNTIGVKAINRNGGTAGLAAVVEVECDAVPRRQFPTNATWRTQLNVLPLWSTNGYRDNRWKPAKIVGTFGEHGLDGQSPSSPTAEQQREVRADQANQGDSEYPEFRLAAGFQIQHVAGGDETGSLIAMAFNEFGQIVASREDGPLILIYDSNDNQIPDAVRVLSDDVQNCQGILPLNGTIFVVGDGPQGFALYRLEDTNRDGDFETSIPIVTFAGRPGQHGPHGIALGPDGLIYMTVGYQTVTKKAYAATSPYRSYYEGDLVPRYEDPQGYTAGIKAPGGGVLRVDVEGRQLELLAGGVRNAHDLAFNGPGDLFLHDSNMKSDEGTPWARPTRLLHIVPGGEYGWRSGWSKWPEYWADCLPAVMDTGRGSPRGCVIYEHNAFPAKYHHAFFSCDWAEGRIVTYHLQSRGASYTAETEIFLQGRPLNVTDIDVGPDGWLYFCTGGRGTQGNLYRVVVPSVAAATPLTGAGILPAVRQPQPQSAWGRQAISTKRHQMGGQWDFELRAFVGDRSQDPADRAQALGLMHLVGPPPTDAELVQLATDPDPRVRRQAACMMGLIGNEPVREALKNLLSDRDALIRRQACESIARSAGQGSLAELSDLLKSPDRFENAAARRLLERSEPAAYEDTLLATTDPNLFAAGAMARLIAAPDRRVAIQLVNRVAALSQGDWEPVDFLRQLRIIELAMERAALQAEDLPVIDVWLAKQFPASDARVNRELVRLLVALQSPQALDSMLAILDGDAPQEDKLHVGLQLRFLTRGWNPRQKARLLAFYEQAGGFSPGGSLGGYLDQVASDFLMTFSWQERQAILDRGEQMPAMALATLFQLTESEDAPNIDRLIALDRRLPMSDDEIIYDLRIGIMAILARHGDERSMAYLRDIYDRDPSRRPAAAMGLAQAPDGRNWDYLVRSIPLLDAEPAKEVLLKLQEVEFAPEEIEYYRQVILCGLRLRNNGGMLASQLLQHWVGQTPEDLGNSWDTALPAWQRWFESAHPAQPKPDLPEERGQNTWILEDLETYLASDEGKAGSIEQGRLVYEKAQCSNCHRHGRIGESYGPDLTSLAQRLSKSEVLESLLFPSQVVADQYVAYQVSTTDEGVIVGQVIPKPNGEFLVVEANGQAVTVAEAEILEILRSRVSSMPEGRINDLSLQEIADLFAFLMHEPPAAVAEK